MRTDLVIGCLRAHSSRLGDSIRHLERWAVLRYTSSRQWLPAALEGLREERRLLDACIALLARLAAPPPSRGPPARRAPGRRRAGPRKAEHVSR